MRKLLLCLVSILLLICTILILVKGVSLGNLQIWGIKEIAAQDENINKENEKLSELVNVTYPEAFAVLQSDSATLEKTKKEYEDQAVLLSDSKYYGQTELYKVEFLFTKIGSYAKDNFIKPTITVLNSSTAGLYDLDITAEGKYSDVSQFIRDIENDSRLGFKIENFAMTSSSEGNVKGTFSCKGIKIDVKSIENAVNANGAKDETTGDTDSKTNTDKKTNTNTNTNTDKNTNTNTNTTNSNETTNNSKETNSTTKDTTKENKTETTNETKN